MAKGGGYILELEDVAFRVADLKQVHDLQNRFLHFDGRVPRVVVTPTIAIFFTQLFTHFFGASSGHLLRPGIGMDSAATSLSQSSQCM